MRTEFKIAIAALFILSIVLVLLGEYSLELKIIAPCLYAVGLVLLSPHLSTCKKIVSPNDDTDKSPKQPEAIDPYRPNDRTGALVRDLDHQHLIRSEKRERKLIAILQNSFPVVESNCKDLSVNDYVATISKINTDNNKFLILDNDAQKAIASAVARISIKTISKLLEKGIGKSEDLNKLEDLRKEVSNGSRPIDVVSNEIETLHKQHLAIYQEQLISRQIYNKDEINLMLHMHFLRVGSCGIGRQK